MAALIDNYLATVEAVLAVDPRLAGRVRDDIEEQVQGLVDERQLPVAEAERRVIGGFGDARLLARAYLRAAWPAHFQRNMLVSAFLIAMSLLCMRLRTAVDNGISGPLVEGRIDILLIVDAAGFAAAVIAAAMAWRIARSDGDALRVPRWLGAAVAGVALSTAASLARLLLARPLNPEGWQDWILLGSGFTELALLALTIVCLHQLARYCRAMA